MRPRAAISEQQDLRRLAHLPEFSLQRLTHCVSADRVAGGRRRNRWWSIRHRQRVAQVESSYARGVADGQDVRVAAVADREILAAVHRGDVIEDVVAVLPFRRVRIQPSIRWAAENFALAFGVSLKGHTIASTHVRQERTIDVHQNHCVFARIISISELSV